MSTLSKSNSFNIDDVFLMCENLYNKRNSGLDCSEMVEDLIRNFGGRALLILSPKHESLNTIEFIDCNSNKHSYVYHYAYVSNDSKVFDPMLGYFDVDYSSYIDRVLGDNSEEPIIEKINGPNLKTFI